LTCKTLADGVACLVLSHICIPTNKKTVEEVVSGLQFLTQPERAAAYSTHKITICTKVLNSSPDDDVLKDGLLTALNSLKVIQSVRCAILFYEDCFIGIFYPFSWHTGVCDPLWLQETIWNAIVVFPTLRHLTIDPSYLRPPLKNLDTLNLLESINISGSFDRNEVLFLGISKLYASSSHLKSITMDNTGLTKLSEGYSLQALFSRSPRDMATHRLRHLAVANVCIRLDEVTLSHLTNLTSFNLRFLPYPTICDDVWNAFRRSRIRLEELRIGYTALGDSFTDYLSSFSGLKKLSISVPTFDSQAFSEASAVKFWTTGFPNHVDTLQDFSLRARFNGQWCFGSHNRALIANCTKLERLTVSLLPEEIPNRKSDFNGIVSIFV
jgi:hypothetical protein